jgi:hypothetical protein
MHVLTIVLAGISMAGFLVWCIHHANRKVMQIIHEEVDAPRLTAEIRLPEPRPAMSTPVVGGESGNSRPPSTDEHDDARKASLGNRAQ